jgi:hypothetical protein
MSRKSGWIGDLFVEGFALAIGWLVCMATVCGVYYLGFLAAPHLGWDSGSQTFGLLSAVAYVWFCEHRHFDEKLDRLRHASHSSAE